ncbi:TetR/AcrR family transcriptional regulator [Sphingobium sp. AN558]|uniref:TetR/AcrR family transcriptional regulator n=1 Tax=Sphingobium sp. AN558 TaxID=3133442 RepID=UPI0030C4E2D9
MTKTAAAISRRDERIKQRQTQIRDAARACVRDEGFHAATISRIAAAAAMSKGHIYKYYENKEAIMIALIEHDMHEFMLLISQLGQSDSRSVDALVDSFVSELPAILDSDRTALWLEVQAEAARNPIVKEMAVKAASYFRDTIRKVIEPVLKGFDREEVDMRVEMLLISMHGLGLKATVHSDAGNGSLATAVEFVFRTVLSADSQSEVARKIRAV